MAALAYTRAKPTGATVPLVAATSGGDTLPPNSSGALLVQNGDSASHTVTVAVPGNTRWGQAEPDITVTVAAGASALIGPLPSDLADPSDGLVHVTYSAVTAVKVAGVVL